MRVLLDENLPHDLAALLSGHEADTVAGRGWSGVENGELLRVASGSYDAFVTMDRLLPEQQRVERLPFAVIVLLAPTNRMSHLRPTRACDPTSFGYGGAWETRGGRGITRVCTRRSRLRARGPLALQLTARGAQVGRAGETRVR
jgi:hypothetical protein